MEGPLEIQGRLIQHSVERRGHITRITGVVEADGVRWCAEQTEMRRSDGDRWFGVAAWPEVDGER